MLGNWAVLNFKSIKTTMVIDSDGIETGELSLKPLTIFCGANSSGKSSIIQSILLMAQTMRDKDSKLPLMLNGDFIRLGTLNDIKSYNAENSMIGIKFAFFLIPMEIASSSYPFSLFKVDLPDLMPIGKIDYKFFISQKKDQQSSLRIPEFELSVQFRPIKPKNEAGNKIPLDPSDRGNPGIYIFKCSWNEKTGYKETMLDPEKKEIDRKFEQLIPDRPEFNHFLPVSINYKVKDSMLMLVLGNIFNFPDSKNFLADISSKVKNDSHIFHFLRENYIYHNGNDNNLLHFLENDVLSGLPDIEKLFIMNHENLSPDGLIFSFSYSDWQLNLKILPKITLKEVKKRMEDNLNKIINCIKNDLDYLRHGTDFDAIKDYYATDSNVEEKNNLWYNEFKNPIQEMEPFESSYSFEEMLSRLYDFFTFGIHYLGPIREDAKLLYNPSDSPDPYNIGSKGEYTAKLLAEKGKEFFHNPVPNREESGKIEFKNLSLKDAVVKWLYYIGVAEDIKAESLKDSYTLQIKTIGSDHFSDLTNVGRGVSQVLPIIVTGLLQREYKLMVFEQPEAHLHPKMQTKLMDFFIAISIYLNRIIIETHSEHFINALRFRLAEMKSPNDQKLADNVQIYFSERDKDGSFFRSLTIDKYSDISEWPEDFFDESQLLSIRTLRAINKKLKQDPPNE